MSEGPTPSERPRVVADIMTRKVVTLFEEENLELIGEGMERLGFRHLPVVDDGKLVGLVTHRDLLRVAVGAFEPGRVERESLLERNVFVAEVMNRDVLTTRETTTIADAARVLREHKFGCLPVVDDEGNLVGIVTESDFLDLLIGLLEP